MAGTPGSLVAARPIRGPSPPLRSARDRVGSSSPARLRRPGYPVLRSWPIVAFTASWSSVPVVVGATATVSFPLRCTVSGDRPSERLDAARWVLPSVLGSSGSASLRVFPLPLGSSGSASLRVFPLPLGSSGSASRCVFPLPLGSSGSASRCVFPLPLWSLICGGRLVRPPQQPTRIWSVFSCAFRSTFCHHATCGYIEELFQVRACLCALGARGVSARENLW